MRKEIFNKELIAKYRDENGFLRFISQKNFSMIVKRNEEK